MSKHLIAVVRVIHSGFINRGRQITADFDGDVALIFAGSRCQKNVVRCFFVINI